jgi:D-amino-acid dehydrogenase
MTVGTPTERRIAVVGAGIIGVATAWALCREGYAVTVIDELAPGESTSFGNAGAISPGSVLPLGHPGMMLEVPRYLLDPLGPLTVRWRHLPRLAPWLARLLRASTPAAYRRLTAELATLIPHTLAAYEPLLEETRLGHLVRRDGMLWAYSSRERLDKARREFEIKRRYGIRVEEIGSEAMRQFEPALAPALSHGIYLPDVGRVLDPGGLVKGIAAHVAERGARLRRAKVFGFDIGPEGPRAVRTEAGEIPADAVVIAAGAWSHRLAAMLGSPGVPLETERGYHVTIPVPGVAPRHMVMSTDGKFLATPMAMGLRLAGTVELASLEAEPDWRRADILLDHAKAMFPGIDVAGASRWMGRRPSLPDSKPVIGRSPRFANVFYGFGHGHLGLTGGALTGRLIADLVAGRTPSIDLGPFRIDRF